MRADRKMQNGDQQNDCIIKEDRGSAVLPHRLVLEITQRQREGWCRC